MPPLYEESAVFILIYIIIYTSLLHYNNFHSEINKLIVLACTYITIRKYRSTFYIGIAMVVLAHGKTEI